MRFWSSSAVLIGARAPANRRGEPGGVEFRRQRLDAEPGERRPLVDPFALDEIHRAEAARVVEDDARAIVEAEDDVVVRGELRPLVVERRHDQRLAALDAERARHAEVHDQRLAAVERGEQILGAPGQRHRSAAPSAARRSAAGTACADRRAASRPWRSARRPASARGRGARSRLRAAQASARSRITARKADP